MKITKVYIWCIHIFIIFVFINLNIKAMDNEIWKPVKGYEGYYEVSNKGNIRSVDRYVKHWRGGKALWKGEMKSLRPTKGYLRTNLRKDGKIARKAKSVHRAVAEAFIPNPNNLPQVNHKDLNRANNNVENLEWVTAHENTEHACKNGAVKKKLTDEEAIYIHDAPMTYRALAAKFGITSVIVDRIKNERAYTYLWKEYNKPAVKLPRTKMTLSDNDILAIQNSNEMQVVLAKRYGVSTSTISNMKKVKIQV